MGTKILILAAMLVAIASSGQAFAREHQTHDGLLATAQVITIRKATAIRLSQPRGTQGTQG